MLARRQSGACVMTAATTYRLWVSDDRCTLLRLWYAGDFEQLTHVEVATRETPAHTWGPPITLSEEKVA